MASWSTGSGFLDSFLEGSLKIGERFLDMTTASSQAKSNQSLAEIERERTAQLSILSQSTQIGSVSIPNWALPAAIGAAGLLWYLKKK